MCWSNWNLKFTKYWNWWCIRPLGTFLTQILIIKISQLEKFGNERCLTIDYNIYKVTGSLGFELTSFLRLHKLQSLKTANLILKSSFIQRTTYIEEQVIQ